MNVNPIEISVIIPNYNCKTFLNACIDSIDRQALDNIEIIIIDDASTDGSQDFLTALAEKRDDLTILFEHSVGPGKARNIGAQAAQGEYLAFLDADDIWASQKLAKQKAFLQTNPEVVLSFTNYQHINENDGHAIIPCFDYWPEFQAHVNCGGNTSEYRILPNATSALFKENVIGTSSVLCRRDAFINVSGFDTELPSASDWDLWLKLSEVGEVAFTTDIAMFYLMRAGSVSSNIPKRIEAIKTIAGRHLDFAKLQSSNAQRFVNERLCDAYCDYSSKYKSYPRRVLNHLKAFTCYPSLRRLKSLVKITLSW